MKSAVRLHVAGVRLLALVGPLLAATYATAQSAGPAPAAQATEAKTSGLTIEPVVSISQTISNTNGGTNWITQVAPGVRVTARRGRVTGHFDYSLQGLGYANSSDQNDIRHALSSALSAELIENRLFIDAQATIGQQAISAFGQQTPDRALPNSNQTQVVSLSVAPVLRGRIAGEIDYTLRTSHALTRASGSDRFNSDVSTASLRLAGGSAQRLSWSVDGSATVYDFNAGRKTESQTVRAQATYAVTPELQVSLIGGQESNDFRSFQNETYDITGASLNWRPGVRTSVFAQAERRFFGTGHNVLAEHRMARTVFRFSDKRDVSAPDPQRGVAVIGTVFDLFFAQFASIEPDPLQRLILVSNFLLANGIAPNTPIFGGFLSSALVLARDQQFSMAWSGLRNTMTLAWQRTSSRRADTFSVAADDFSNTAVVNQRSLSANVSHRLSEQEAINVGLTFLRSSGDLPSQTSTLKSVTGTWTSQLSKNLSGSLGLRLSDFNGISDSYSEYALIGTLTMRF